MQNAGNEERLRRYLDKKKAREMNEEEEVAAKPVLLLTGPSWCQFDFSLTSSRESAPKERFIVQGKPIYLFAAEKEGGTLTSQQQPYSELSHTVHTAFNLWDCSIVLSKFLEYQVYGNLETKDKIYSVQAKRCLELGSGRGLVGVVASRLGASHVTLTDMPEVLCSLEQVAYQFNGLDKSVCSVKSLDWFKSGELKSEEKDYDCILASDVIWVDELISPLAETMCALCKSTRTTILLCHQTRCQRSDDHFFRAIAERGLAHELIPRHLYHPSFQRSTIGIFAIYRPLTRR